MNLSQMINQCLFIFVYVVTIITFYNIVINSESAGQIADAGATSSLYSSSLWTLFIGVLKLHFWANPFPQSGHPQPKTDDNDLHWRNWLLGLSSNDQLATPCAYRKAPGSPCRVWGGLKAPWGGGRGWAPITDSWLSLRCHSSNTSVSRHLQRFF